MGVVCHEAPILVRGRDKTPEKGDFYKIMNFKNPRHFLASSGQSESVADVELLHDISTQALLPPKFTTQLDYSGDSK